jgi:large subunit ribosomal protein L23
MRRRTIILHPYVTEKTMNAMSGTPSQDLKDGNKLEFVVRKSATKPEIKRAFEERFEAKVEKINVKLMGDGKHAIIKLKEGYSAEDIGMRIGIF